MANFLRGKQAGIQRDLSASIRPEIFTPDDQARYGINSQIRCAAIPPPFEAAAATEKPGN